MTYILWISIIALIAAVATFLSGRGVARSICDIHEVAGRSVPVNLAAFRQLLDPRDTAFLRDRLAPPDLRRVQRLRSRAALGYMAAIFTNTAVLIRIGELARATGELDVVAAGTRLLNVAMRVRLLTSLAMARAAFSYCWPLQSCSADSLIEAYESLRAQMIVVARMQDPAAVSRLAASL